MYHAIVKRIATQNFERVENHGVHIVRMRWGKVVEIDANEDSQVLADSLKVIAAQGMEEALAAPIVS